MQSVSGRELDEERHRRANEMGVRRFAVLPGIYVALHHATRIVDVTAVEAGTMVDVFPDDREPSGWSAMTFSSAGDPR